MIATPNLAAALRAIIAANNDFRAGMPKDWEGDPLQDAINDAEKLLAGNGEADKEGRCPHCGEVGDHDGYCGVC